MPTPSVPARRRLRAAVLGLLTMLAVLVPAAVAAPAASAAPCQTCPEPPPNDPTPHPPAPPVVTHRLTIKKIVCYDTNDNQSWHFLNDEVYINFNGQRLWGIVSVDYLTGTYTVNATKDVVGPPGGPYLGRLEMWDHDTTSAGDRLADLSVYGNGSPTEISGTYDFHMSDSHYSMEISMRQL
jgi:hypothetical protein